MNYGGIQDQMPESRADNAWRKSAIASFLSLPKTEQTGCKACPARNDTRAGVGDYIQRFCKLCTRHAEPRDSSPMEFEARVTPA